MDGRSRGGQAEGRVTESRAGDRLASKVRRAGGTGGGGGGTSGSGRGWRYPGGHDPAPHAVTVRPGEAQVAGQSKAGRGGLCVQLSLNLCGHAPLQLPRPFQGSGRSKSLSKSEPGTDRPFCLCAGTETNTRAGQTAAMYWWALDSSCHTLIQRVSLRPASVAQRLSAGL